MNTNKKISLAGMLVALAYTAYAAYTGLKISSGFGIGESMNELSIALITGLVMALPFLLAYFLRGFKKNITWLHALYLAVLLLGLGNLFLANDPLAGGLPMVTVVLPLAVVTSIVMLVFKK